MKDGTKILYGRDEEKNITKIETLRNQNLVHIFKRVDGKVEDRYEPLSYVIFINEKDVKKLPKNVTTTKLKGKNHFNIRVNIDDYKTFYQVKQLDMNMNVPYQDSQYMIQTGKTCMKGMSFNDPVVVEFDLEVLTSEGYNFPNADREEDKIIIIAMKSNKGDEMLFYLGKPEKKEVNGVKHFVCKNERALLNDFLYQFKKIDPDVVANHNIFNFDLPYLETRAKMNDVKLILGRDGSEPSSYETAIKFGDRARQYNNYSIYGRTVIDTQFLAEYADVVMRKMPSYGLKQLVRFLGKESKERTYIKGEEIADVWRGNHDTFTRDDLVNYAIDDVREAEILYKEFGQSIFMLTKMVPMNFQEVFRYGTGNQVEFVFNREYIHQEESLPKADPYRKIKGGYADVLLFGQMMGSIMYADVKSLYPSLGKLLNIKPKKDTLNLYQIILEELTDMRYAIKEKIAQYREIGIDEMVSQQKATDGAVKIFLNTMSYGFLAFGHSGFNDFDEAERITLNGQKIIKRMIDVVKKDGGTPIKVDTDGVALKVPTEWLGKEDEYCVRLTNELPDGIIIENDGLYDGIISFDRKSYALLNKDGDGITTKGNTIMGRGVEPFYTELISHTIKYLFDKEDTPPQEIFNKYKSKIENRKLEKEDVQKRSSLKKTLEEYQMQRDAGDCNMLAQYELAIDATRPYQKGDILMYYIKQYPFELTTYYGKPTVRKKNCKVYESAELIENYNYDFEPDYYIDRLEKAARKFMVLGKEKFEKLFDVKVMKSDITKIEKITKQDYETTSKQNDKQSS